MSTRAERFAWCLYDFANSSFPTVIVTVVYVIYFKNVVVGEGHVGLSDRLWGMANSLAAAVVFLTAPFLGAVADAAGRKRAFLAVYAFACVVATALLALTGPGTVALAVTLFTIASIGFEGSVVFYNAFLPELVPADRMERLSGAGWALGYVGGLACLLVVLPFAKSHTSLVPLAVAGWYLVFSLPSLALLRDRARPSPGSLAPSVVAEGGRRFLSTLRGIGEHRSLSRFLTAYFFFENAIVTVIVFTVAFTKDTLGFTITENIILVVVMNAIAAPGAYAFGRVAERIGCKRTLVVTVCMWLAVVAGAEVSAWPGLFTAPGAKSVFWGVATLASLCIGASQATARTFVAQLAPEGRSGEFFGFMAFAGKGSAILGPIVFGLASDISGSQRVAVATIGAFFLAGLVLLLRVPAPSCSSADCSPQ
ncbi:MAG: MFS transporter [Deltaproteobacteria bacterium]|nr:MFS transporter [Deltaproteobacteria bacterium]